MTITSPLPPRFSCHFDCKNYQPIYFVDSFNNRHFKAAHAVRFVVSCPYSCRKASGDVPEVAPGSPFSTQISHPSTATPMILSANKNSIATQDMWEAAGTTGTTDRRGYDISPLRQQLEDSAPQKASPTKPWPREEVCFAVLIDDILPPGFLNFQKIEIYR